MERIVEVLHHRGPDARGVWNGGTVELGHTRLCVIDIGGGAQPMADESGRVQLVFNGEIYNYRELRRELKGRGRRFRTQSDTEVLLAAYLEWKHECPKHLNGQFAFAVWDESAGELLIARDRMGEKPLYYATTADGRFVVASEIKGILAAGGVSDALDLVSVDAYLAMFYVPPDRTIYRDVKPLRPGHAGVWREGQLTTWRYWEPKLSTNRGMAEADAVEQIQRLMGAAVERQMVADVPLGAFLSGGLDSSTIVALMAERSEWPIETFAVGFGDLINELPFAREVAGRYRTKHHEIQMDIDVAGQLDRMVQVYDEPFGDSSNIPTYLLCGYARQNVTVALSGDGGDELFGGYAWYEPLIGDTDATAPFRRHVENATHLYFDRNVLWGEGRQPAAVREIERVYGSNRALMDVATRFDLECYLAGDILVKVDRASMAHGLETRSPFLDADLVEFVLALPWEMRFAGGGLKHLMREAFGGLWPASVRDRGKQGFGAPVAKWLEQPAVANLFSRVTGKGSKLAELLPGLAGAMPTIRPQRRWSLLCLGMWLESRSVTW